METVATPCEDCGGKRFQAEVLEYKLGGKDISEVLAMPVTEAAEFFGAGPAKTPAAHTILTRMADVGLGYLGIGQPLTTLSGGERQRLKLATYSRSNNLAGTLAEKGGMTSRPRASISPTWRICSVCWTGWWIPASRSSSSSTTWR
jgi:excinuclease UvrABC ATPase subunit